jgi:glutamate---cysteine ligase / carboxylate-amine ligase
VSEGRAEDIPAWHLFEVCGIEIEYMIVDRDTLSVLPVTDRVLKSVAGDFVNEVETGSLAWSNELALHVIELKTNGPAPSLAGLDTAFHGDVSRINGLLEEWNGRLMPTAMHPWMDPQVETRLWPHDYNPIYEAFNRIFDCRGHGWSNLQSTHINLPFANDAEFAQLHAALRFVLPLLPALAASSPVIDGKPGGSLDNRLAVYRTNARRIPSVSGNVIPEPIYSRRDYERHLLQRIYDDLAPHDPEGVLRHEWVNARGAIARFDRNAIEIRVLDTQECPAADLALAALIIETVRALGEEAWCGLTHLKDWDTRGLEAIFLTAVRDADHALISDRRYLAAFGFPERGPARARDLWQHLIEILPSAGGADPGRRRVFDLYLRRGALARRISAALGPAPSRDALMHVYGRLCDCLAGGTLFDG